MLVFRERRYPDIYTIRPCEIKHNIITKEHSYQLALSNAGEFHESLKIAPYFFSLLQQDSKCILLFNH
jgi:hypothetical protein